MTLKDKNLYYVGGFVRDEILGTKNFDIDFCYEGNAINFAKNLDIIKTNPDFGTVKVLYNNEEIDIASTRNEIYPKAGHLPIVNNIGCSLEEDLKRRDFTINALAKNTLSEEIIDYFNGLEDIKNKTLRVLHSKSFIDDPTRIIRALKFAVRFGFELDKKTKKLQDEYLSNINYDMSYHRLKKELKETFNLNSEKAYKRFVIQGIYKLLGENQSIPEVRVSIAELVTKYKPNHIWLIYLGLFNLSNLELTGEEQAILNAFYNVKDYVFSNDFEIWKAFNNIPLESILLYAITTNKEIACKYLDTLCKIQIEISGDDLKNLGLPEGKIFKEIFDFITDKKLKNPNITKNDEIKLVKENFLCH